MEKRTLGLIEVEGREQRYTRRLAISGFSRNTREYLYACIGCIRSVYTYPLFSLPGGSPTSRISPLKLDGVYHEPGGNARSIRYVRTLPRSHELSVPRTAIPSLNRNGNVGRSRRPDRYPSPHSLCTAEGGRIMHLRGLSCSIVANSLDTELRVSRNYLLVDRALTSNWQPGGNGLNIRDEEVPTRGVSKSSVRYVSTSLEGWIGRGNKMGARSRGLVRLKGEVVEEGEVGGGSQWSAHLADPTSLTSLMIYVELQAP